MILKSITPELRAELTEASALLSKQIKKAEQGDRRSARLQEDFDKLGQELEALNGKSFLSDAESSRLSAVIARRASLQTHIEEDEAHMSPARQEMVAAYNECNAVLGKVATLASAQTVSELAPLLEPFYLPENAKALAARSDLAQGVMMECMRHQYALPSSLSAAIAVAKRVVELLNNLAEERDFFLLQPAV